MKKTIRIKSVDEDGNEVITEVKIPIKEKKDRFFSKKKQEEKADLKVIKKPKRQKEILDEDEEDYLLYESDYEEDEDI
jgi:hypothetical protein